MEAKKTGVGFLKEYRAHPENYLPLIDHQYHSWIGWNEKLYPFSELDQLNEGAVNDIN